MSNGNHQNGSESEAIFTALDANPNVELTVCRHSRGRAFTHEPEERIERESARQVDVRADRGEMRRIVRLELPPRPSPGGLSS